MNECIHEDILADFFRKHRNEVVEMGIYEFDPEVIRKICAAAAKYAPEYDAKKIMEEYKKLTNTPGHAK